MEQEETMEIIKNQLAAAILDEYEDLNLGERIDETTMRSFDGESSLELVSHESKELEVIIDGTSVLTLSYEDERFHEKLLIFASSALGF